MRLLALLAAGAHASALSAPALAQDHSGHDHHPLAEPLASAEAGPTDVQELDHHAMGHADSTGSAEGSGTSRLSVARELVLFLRQPGGQSQLSANLSAQASASGTLEGLLVWIADNPDADLSLPALAERAAMSERNFGRVFARQTGMTPAHYVESVRLDRAEHFLETSD